jgi:hypothetical protein
MPTPSKRQDNGWYSFEMGPVHFLIMDTELSAYNGSDQLAFFEADLGAVDRMRTPFVIFAGHRPMYTSSAFPFAGKRPTSASMNLEDGPWWPDVERTLIKHGVDLCLWGHVHNAEVTCPIAHGRCVPPGAGPIHAVIGNAGQSISPFCLPGNTSCW